MKYKTLRFLNFETLQQQPKKKKKKKTLLFLNVEIGAALDILGPKARTKNVCVCVCVCVFIYVCV